MLMLSFPTWARTGPSTCPNEANDLPALYQQVSVGYLSHKARAAGYPEARVKVYSAGNFA